MQRAVLASDTSALRLVFQLKSITDGHAGEELNWIEDTAIRSMPGPWLRAVRSEGIPAIRLGYMLGTEYLEGAERRRELAARREALLSVSDLTIQPLRDSIVVMLEEQLSSR